MTAISHASKEAPLANLSSLTPLLDQLHAIPKERYSACVHKVKQIAQALCNFSMGDSLLNGRVQYLGTNFLLELQKPSASHELSAIESILYEIANFKNALQVEAVYYGAISKMFDRHYRISQIPQLKELWAEMPFMFRNIIHDQTMLDCFRINLRPINEYFSKFDLDTLPDSFDTTLIQIFQLYPIQGDELIIPFGCLPSIELIEAYMESSDFHSKLLAQILFFCKIEEDNIFSEHTSKFVSSHLLSSLRAQPFDFYLTKKELVPLLGHFIENTEKLKAIGADCLDLLFDEAFLRGDHLLKSSDWIEDASVCFDLLRRIELGVRKIFKIGMLAPVDERILAEGCDKKVLMWTKAFDEIETKYSYPLAYPISDAHPFVLDKASFKMLSFPVYIEANHSRIREARELVALKALKKALKAEGGKKKAPKSKPAALTGGACSAEAYVAPKVSAAVCGAGKAVAEEADEELDFSVFFHGKKPAAKATASAASVKALRPRSSSFEASLKLAYEHLTTLEFHKRIKVWQRSEEAGLDYYQFGQAGISHDLTREEMILRHRLPKDLLLLSLDPHFGVKKSITLSSGEVIENHFESCLMIDGKKYILETSINKNGVVFHFYARRITNIQDYQQMLTFSPSEYPTIQRLAIGSIASEDEGKEFEGIDVARLSFDKDGNALCVFESHTYQVPILKPFDKA